MHERIVAKFGGTSMARPERAVDLLASEYDPIAVVVSAPGQDVDNRSQPKLTDLLYAFQSSPGSDVEQAILGRLYEVACRYSDGLELNAVVAQAPADLEEWHREGLPLAALGER